MEEKAIAEFPKEVAGRYVGGVGRCFTIYYFSYIYSGVLYIVVTLLKSMWGGVLYIAVTLLNIERKVVPVVVIALRVFYYFLFAVAMYYHEKWRCS